MEMQSLQNEKCGTQDGVITLSSSLLLSAKESQPSPSAPALTHVNQNETQTDDNKVGKEGADMSDDIAKIVGRLEANYEHMQRQQAELKVSIDNMPTKITESIKKEIASEIKELKSDILLKNKDFEIKIAWWILALFIAIIFMPFIKENVLDKKQPNSEIITSIDKTNTLLESLLENKQNIVPIIPKQKEQSKQ
jgi:hypothetical protein